MYKTFCEIGVLKERPEVVARDGFVERHEPAEHLLNVLLKRMSPANHDHSPYQPVGARSGELPGALHVDAPEVFVMFDAKGEDLVVYAQSSC